MLDNEDVELLELVLLGDDVELGLLVELDDELLIELELDVLMLCDELVLSP